MLKKGRKVISLLTVILMVLLSAVPMASAVAYPEGVTPQALVSTVEKTDTIVEALMKLTKEGSLENMLYPQLFSDEVLSSLTVGVYSGIEENAESISALGLNVSTKGVAKHLGAYPEVKAKLESLDEWQGADLSGAAWGVSDKEGFIKAMACVFAPFNELIYTLLCAGKYSINPVIGFEGDKGYENAIIPALKALGCQTITDSATFYAKAKENRNSMVESILGDIFVLADRAMKAPCNVLTEILPGIAHFLNSGGFDKAVASLIEPVKLQLFNISTFIKVETILSFIQDSESYTQSFTLNFNDILGDTGLKMAEIDLEELASCGTANSDGTVTSDKAATFAVLLRWVIDTAKLNKDSLSDMMGEDAVDMSKMIDKLMAKETDEIIRLLVDLLNAEKGEINNYTWTFAPYEAGTVTYTANLSEEKFQRVVDGIDELLDQVVAEGGQYKTVKDALRPEIYSNKLVSTLVCEIYSMLSGEDFKAVAELAGMDVSPAMLAQELTEMRFTNTRYVLSHASSWSKVNVNTLTWGFKNGDRDGFLKALTAALRPMESILTMLLCQGRIQIMNSVDIYGSDGYNTAVIPMLEALGCDSDSILTYEEFEKASRKGKGTEKLLDTILTLVDRVLERPVYTITQILPNLLYFINSGSLETCIENLMYPFISLLKEFGMEDMLDMSQVTSSLEIDPQKLIADMTKGNASASELGIDLSEFDLSAIDIEVLGKMGQATTVQSKRTSNGAPVQVTYIKANQPAMMVTLMRQLATILKGVDNDMVDELLGSMEGVGENQMVSGFAGGITADIAAMSTDETVEWLYKLFFRERPIVPEETQEEYMPTIIYNPENSGAGFVWVLLVLFVIAGALIFLWKTGRLKKIFSRKSTEDFQEV